MTLSSILTKTCLIMFKTILVIVNQIWWWANTSVLVFNGSINTLYQWVSFHKIWCSRWWNPTFTWQNIMKHGIKAGRRWCINIQPCFRIKEISTILSQILAKAGEREGSWKTPQSVFSSTTYIFKENINEVDNEFLKFSKTHSRNHSVWKRYKPTISRASC